MKASVVRMAKGPKTVPRNSPGKKLRPRFLRIQPVIRPGTTAQKKTASRTQINMTDFKNPRFRLPKTSVGHLLPHLYIGSSMVFFSRRSEVESPRVGLIKYVKFVRET